MNYQEIKFKNKTDKYSIFIGENSFNLLPKKIKSLCPKTKKIGVVIDKNLPLKFKKKIKDKLKNYEIIFFQFKYHYSSKKNYKIFFVMHALVG